MNRKELSAKMIVGIVGLTAGIASAQVKSTPAAPQGPQFEVAAPAIACFAEGTDPRYVSAVNSIVHQLNVGRLGTDYQLNTRWSGAQGSPRALTWSLVPDGILLGSGASEPNTASNMFSTFDAAYAGQGGRATWVNRFVQIFARWQALSGLTFTRITVGGNDWDDGAAFPGTAGAAGARGDCRIGGHPIDGASNILAYCYFPATGDCVMDTNDTANFSSSTNQNRFIRNTIGHEFGHGIGLNHVESNNAAFLMEPFLSTAFDGPQQDDIRAAQRHYGDPYEANDTFGTAKPIGAVLAGSPVTFGTQPAPLTGVADPNATTLSIDANGEVDFWSFTVNQAVNLTATVTPVGSTYNQGPQGGAQAALNALTIADLAIDVIASNGTTVLGTASGAGAGLPETAASVSLPGAGTYYLRVFESNAPGETQHYRLNVSAVNTTIVCPSFTLQPAPLTTICEGGTIALSVAVSGSPAPTLQWRRNGVDIFGETNPNFNLFLANPGTAAGTYTCVATTAGCAPVVSNNAVVVVNTFIGINVQPSSQVVNAGSPVSFTVSATGTPTPTYQWRKNSVNIGGANSPTYTIASTVVGDAGSYDCVLTNSCDSQTTDAATLTVNAGSSCYANCDLSTTPPVLNANDFNCFLNAFAAGNTYANCDGSTTAPVLNANDFNCFLNKFAAGCT